MMMYGEPASYESVAMEYERFMERLAKSEEDAEEELLNDIDQDFCEDLN